MCMGNEFLCVQKPGPLAEFTADRWKKLLHPGSQKLDPNMSWRLETRAELTERFGDEVAAAFQAGMTGAGWPPYSRPTSVGPATSSSSCAACGVSGWAHRES